MRQLHGLVKKATRGGVLSPKNPHGVIMTARRCFIGDAGRLYCRRSAFQPVDKPVEYARPLCGKSKEKVCKGFVNRRSRQNAGYIRAPRNRRPQTRDAEATPFIIRLSRSRKDAGVWRGLSKRRRAQVCQSFSHEPESCGKLGGSQGRCAGKNLEQRRSRG